MHYLITLEAMPNVKEEINSKVNKYRNNFFFCNKSKKRLFLVIFTAGADTAHNLMGRSPRKIGLGGVSAAGGSAPQAKNFMGIG